MITNPDGSVTHSKEEWAKIEEELDWLSCLEAAGVDNWQGYDDARAIQAGEAE